VKSTVWVNSRHAVRCPDGTISVEQVLSEGESECWSDGGGGGVGVDESETVCSKPAALALIPEAPPPPPPPPPAPSDSKEMRPSRKRKASTIKSSAVASKRGRVKVCLILFSLVEFP
jgi:hypothetical protein